MVLPFEIHELLQHLIARGDSTGVGLKCPLRDDHIDKFFAKIDIGLLNGLGNEPPQSIVRRSSVQRRAGVHRFSEPILTGTCQSIRICKSAQHDLGKGSGLAVGKLRHDSPDRIDRQILKRPGSKPILSLVGQIRCSPDIG